jgi:hypothetical protein
MILFLGHATHTTREVRSKRKNQGIEPKFTRPSNIKKTMQTLPSFLCTTNPVTQAQKLCLKYIIHYLEQHVHFCL